MTKSNSAFFVLMLLASLVQADPLALHAGESFVQDRSRLYADGWREDPAAHASSGEYFGLDRELVQQGYPEVDYCSQGKSFCVLQYTKGPACLRVYTEGEHIKWMTIRRWGADCREKGSDEPADMPPADVRYLIQWRSDCESDGRCRGVDDFLWRLKRKYVQSAAVMKVLKLYNTPLDVHAGSGN